MLELDAWQILQEALMSCEMWEQTRIPRAVALATLLAQLFPLEMIELFTCCDQKWTIPMTMGRWEVISMAMIWSELAVESPFVVNSLHFFQMTVCERRIWKAYLESV